MNLRFRRQHRIGNYIVDFFCPELDLAIELDGDSHSDRRDYDQERSTSLATFDCRVLRFDNTDVFEHIDAVLLEISRCAEQLKSKDPSPLPSPRVQGEGGALH